MLKKLSLFFLLLFSPALTACAIMPEGLKPDWLYGETYGQVKTDIPKNGARIESKDVPASAPADDLSHVFDELGGESGTNEQ